MRSLLRITFKVAAGLAITALVIGGIMRAFFVHEVQVGHNGMAPTMITGEIVLMWNDAEPDLGDIVVCEHPGEAGSYVMGRIIALQAMTVMSTRGQLSIEGDVPDRDIVGRTDFYDVDNDTTDHMMHGIEIFHGGDHLWFMKEGHEMRVREHQVAAGMVFLLGDNRSYVGRDSRAFGDVDPTTCIGEVFMRWAPVDDHGADLGHSYLDILD